MNARQSIPTEWLIVRSDEDLAAVSKLPRGTGVLVLQPLGPREHRRLQRLAHVRRLTVVEERAPKAARVHNLRELRAALLKRTPLILLSPLYPTASHPDWRPIPRMRAGTMARLGGRRLIALGGMDPKRYGKVAPLGFVGWAGISAFRT